MKGASEAGASDPRATYARIYAAVSRVPPGRVATYGQIASAAAIDHFGLFGAVRSEISTARVCGVILMAVGVFLARKPLG